MTVQKGTWKSMVTSCFKPHVQDQKEAIMIAAAATAKPPSPRPKVARENSFQRVSITDLSNPDSWTSDDLTISLAGTNLHVFTLQELKLITQGFSSCNFIGEGGFGPVHKGFIDDKLRPGLKAQPVAVKLLDLEGAQGHREWLTEVIFLGQLSHPHLVNLIGYCCEEEHRVLVYEYMPRGSLENQLFRRFSVTLPWSTRMKIAYGAAKGLAFLHELEKPVIYRDFKASNILLDSDYTAKLSDFGLAKDGPEGSETHVSTRVMGTHGYAAPEYIMTGHLTAMSDVYSFGVVLLELLTGRRSVDKNRPQREQNLVEWARSSLTEPRKLGRIMDPGLEGQYSESGARRAAALAYQCLSQRPKHRPTMSAVVKILEPLKDYVDIPIGTFVYTVPPETVKSKEVGPDCNGKESDDTSKEERTHKPHHHHHRHHKVHHSNNNRHHQVHHSSNNNNNSSNNNNAHSNNRHPLRSPRSPSIYSDAALGQGQRSRSSLHHRN